MTYINLHTMPSITKSCRLKHSTQSLVGLTTVQSDRPLSVDTTNRLTDSLSTCSARSAVTLWRPRGGGARGAPVGELPVRCF